MFRGFEPGAFKLIKITMKNVKVSDGLELVSFRVVAHDATTELQDSILKVINTTYLIKPYVY